jgi:uncharacterized protein
MRIAASDEGVWLIGDHSFTRLPSWAVTRTNTPRRMVRGALSVLEKVGKPPASSSAYHLTVLTTTNCNLGCAYCFQNVGAAKPGTFRPPRIDAKSLSPDSAREIADFTRRHMQSAGTEELDLLIFGGEPLLVPNTVLSLLEIMRPLGLQRARMISNGVGLDIGLSRKLESAGLNEVQITFDGQQTDHDAVRRDHRGNGTYSAIVKNVAAAQGATDLRFNIRINVTDDNHRGIHGLIADLGSRLEAGRCKVHIALVDATGAGFTGVPKRQDIADEFVAWHITALDNGFDVEPPAVDSRCVYCDKRRGVEGAVVNADGVLYSCWDSAGQAAYDVGNAAEGYYPDKRVDDRWVSCGYQGREQRGQGTGELIDRAAVAVLEWKSARNAR